MSLSKNESNCSTCLELKEPSESDLIKCVICQKFFCNRESPHVSTHIIHHMISERHFYLEKNKNPICCGKCDAKNFFSLGFIKNSKKKFNLKDIICRKCCDFNPNFTSLTIDRKIYTKIVNYKPKTSKSEKKGDLKKIESLKDLEAPIPLRFTYSEYINYFKKLLEVEKEEEKSIRKEMTRNNVNLTVVKDENKTTIRFECDFETNKLAEGVRVLIYKTTEETMKLIEEESKKEILKEDKNDFLFIFRGEGIITYLGDYIEVRLINKQGDIPYSASVEFLWNNVGYERMLLSLDYLKFVVPKNLRNLILKGPEEIIMKEEDFAKKKFSLADYVESLKLEPKKNANLKLPKVLKRLNLNFSQEEAIRNSINIKNEILTMIQGPPGTGKSLCCAIIAYNLKFTGKVLITAPSNIAIDNIAKKLLTFDIKILRIVSKSKEILSEKDNTLNKISMSKLIPENCDRKTKLSMRKKLMDEAEIILCTCVTSGKDYVRKQKIPYVIIDECAQAIEPLSLIPMMRKEIKKVVLIGDHKQLGPVILNQEVAKRYKMYRSFFERLVILGYNVNLLSVQYRMDPVLIEFPSNEFYKGAITTDYTVNYKKIVLTTKESSKERIISEVRKKLPATFLYQSSGKESLNNSGRSYFNMSQLNVCLDIVHYLKKCGVSSESIGIITPYEAQKQLIMTCFQEKNILDIEVANVDAFQGREKDFIILSLVRGNFSSTIGFISEVKRVNVAITRSKYGLFVVADINTISKEAKKKDHKKSHVWQTFVDFYRKNNRIITDLNF